MPFNKVMATGEFSNANKNPSQRYCLLKIVGDAESYSVEDLLIRKPGDSEVIFDQHIPTLPTNFRGYNPPRLEESYKARLEFFMSVSMNYPKRSTGSKTYSGCKCRYRFN